MPIKVTPTDAVLGAEIGAADLTKEIDDATFDQIRAAFYQHEVVIFRGRELSDDDHIRFSARFGELRRAKIIMGAIRPRRPEFSVVSNIIENSKHIGSYEAGMFWHTDGAYQASPHAASLLRAIEVPQQGGRTFGATLFASMTAAYDALSSAMKKRIDGLTAVHSAFLRDAKAKQETGHPRQERPAEQKREAVHPVVRLHPITKRKCLYVSDGFTARILELPEDESKDLLAELTAHCTQPQFLYTHNWQVHDLVMWDDCSTQHKATFDYALPLRRLMYRTTVTKFV